MDNIINKILEDKKANLDEALQIFDSLSPTTSDFMIGRWKGCEIDTGHPMNGILSYSGWYGKLFLNNESVHPLLFYAKKETELYAVNPKLVPMKANVPRKKILRSMIELSRLFLATKEPKARLRKIEYRGKLCAAMVYDDIPVIDMFAKIDDNSVLGIMDFKKEPEPFIFSLERDDNSDFKMDL